MNVRAQMVRMRALTYVRTVVIQELYIAIYKRARADCARKCSASTYVKPYNCLHACLYVRTVVQGTCRVN